MQRAFSRFVGVDLGGGRGKTTAVAELRMAPAGGAEVIEVATRAGKLPWTDDTLIGRLAIPDPERVIAVDAPLTQTACGRCERPVCPGTEACADPAVVWLRTTGRALDAEGRRPRRSGGRARATARSQSPQARLAPYAHRATDVVMTYQRGLLPLSSLGAANSTITARAGQLRRRLRGAGYQLHGNLLEVSPAGDDRRAVRTARCARLQARRRSVGHARAGPREASTISRSRRRAGWRARMCCATITASTP